MPAPLAPDTPGRERLQHATTDTDAHTARADSKTSLLLAFNGALLAGLFAARPSLPSWGLAAAAASGAALLTSAVLQLLVVLPRINNHDNGSFAHWANLDPDDLPAALEAADDALRLHALSVMARTKYRLLRWAIILDLAAIGLLAITGTSLL